MTDYLKDIFKPFTLFNIKGNTSTILAAITATLASYSQDYLGISGKFAFALLVVIAADFVTGIHAALKNDEELTIKKGLRTFHRSGAYLVFIYVAYSLYTEVKDTSSLFAYTIKYFHIYLISHVCFWELFSIDKNLKRIGIDLGITDILKNGYNKISNIFNNLGKSNIETDNNNKTKNEKL